MRLGAMGARGGFGSAGVLGTVSSVAHVLSQLKQKVVAGTAANIGAFGDSTGDGSTEWIRVFTNWLAATYPSNTTTYRLVTDGTGWPAATNIATGGAGPIEMWNASRAGQQATYYLGARRTWSIDGMPASLDLAIINYGLNSASYTASYSPRGQLIALIEAIKLKWPTTPILVVNQNPNRDDNLMAAVNTAWIAIEAIYPDVGVLDIYTPFIAAGKAAALYDDNIHPSVPATTAGKGQYLIVEALKTLFNAASRSSLITPSAAHLATNATNLLSNGDFAAYTGSEPDSWSLLGAATATKDTGVVDPLYGTYSVRLDGSVANIGIQQTLSAPALAACKAAGGITVAARIYTPPGSATSVGSIGTTAFGSPNDTLEVAIIQAGGWMWMIAQNMPAPSGASSLTVNLFVRTAGSGAVASHFSRVIAVAGALPRNMA
jgi:hypothetical protein